ncbi:MAG: DUF1501 domain-containing protein, partial [Dehalococcoidia bacterium]|nr:DUF1501 domain-containing protein [Dehalococcoidia bacterium]
LMGCSAAIAALSGSRITGLSFGDPAAAQAPDNEILVQIFLRGGIDGLNLIVPYGDPAYAVARPTIRIAEPGRTRGAIDINGFFGFHPATTGLNELYQAGLLAIVVATGLTDPTRSHFDAMAMMERGTPGSTTALATGWIARHLVSANVTGTLPALVVANQVPAAMIGALNVATIPSLNGYNLAGRNAEFQRLQRETIQSWYSSGTSWLHNAGTETLSVLSRIQQANPGSYTPANGARYPDNGFGRSLQVVAQLIKMNLGVRAATVDFGGWDTHESQGDDGQGFFANQVATLANGLLAFHTDLADVNSRLTVVVMSEFGRRLRQNNSNGTDHGHGNVMLVSGGAVRGGLYGVWPGLSADKLNQGNDLDITTDYRQVLSEILVRRQRNGNLAAVFPGMPTYTPLGLMRGEDIPVTQGGSLPQRPIDSNGNVIGGPGMPMMPERVFVPSVARAAVMG